MRCPCNLRPAFMVLVAAYCLLGIAVPSTFGHSYEPLTLEEMTLRASLIVVGTVASNDYQWDPGISWSYLSVTLNRLAVVTGTSTSQTITLRRLMANLLLSSQGRVLVSPVQHPASRCPRAWSCPRT